MSNQAKHHAQVNLTIDDVIREQQHQLASAYAGIASLLTVEQPPARDERRDQERSAGRTWMNRVQPLAPFRGVRKLTSDY
ncbi:hypothetical protein [Paenibacillus spongiae]|uniref:Uncharacterized protein n=1 Tax=Paenibacillus spongiae TaxID=2909671 RepID=A0ABY5SCD6_9BACL|nr:hypothetical protein [Paenibacillus spongiae]UVI31319.1 hypothetical protein L1F29_05610 [Paenibacillus spongiae]